MIKYSEVLNGEKKNINFEDSESYAYVTHLLHTLGMEQARCFSNKAIEFILQNDALNNAILDGKEIVSESTGNHYKDLLLDLEFDIPFPPNEESDFTFIDLFAGIGGFRLALDSLKGKCVFSSEIDKYCKQVYESNFGEIQLMI